MFLINLLISCMFALAPVNNVQPVQDQQYNEVLERKNFISYGNSSGTGNVYDYGTTDLLSFTFIDSVLKFISDIDLPIYNGWAPNNTWNYDFDLTTGNFYSNNTLYRRLSDSSDNGTSLGTITNFSVSKVNSTPNYYNLFVFTFYINTTDFINYQVIYYYGQNNGPYAYYLSNPDTSTWQWYHVYERNEGFFYQFIAKPLLENNQDSFNSGYDYGYNVGRNAGYGEGLSAGLEGATNPQSATYQQIYNEGKQVGYQEGLNDGLERDSVASTIFTGFVDVGLLPVNVFLQMFEYEVFGINIAGLMSGVLTIAIVVIIVRLVTGKKND